ncbi:MAG: M18 family aminopeptidase [Gammaproteobacteria bacterium]|nr:M18 family aminopeptidase [Gammaproteobacteria bacterium]MDP2139293.1 M18 family aminopeptidase [Gammaproteobacteria bacterium]MDP2346778.1 M18 family aminopeptidase [Gammaproteobacteria bacterium]
MQHVDKDSFNSGLLEFIAASPTPFHAVGRMVAVLAAAGYQPLDEAQAWELQRGGRYYVTRNGSSIIAFNLIDSELDLASQGVKLAGAHTDSPCLRIKPQPDMRKNNYVQLGVEVYGGALLNPWFDRDLSFAGRVDYIDANQTLGSCLIDIGKAVAVIPSLAIHLDREANQSKSINAQKELPPLLSISGVRDGAFDDFLLHWLRDHAGVANATRVLSHELSLYDTQAPALIGLHDEFISSARLDNLLSCYVSLQALLAGDAQSFNMLVCSDHEEVGSASASGAQGPFLRSVLERIISCVSLRVERRAEDFERLMRNSLLISIDNAHGIHPNYVEKHDSNHGPILNQGPVVKINANQRYASNSTSVARFKAVCSRVDVPVQAFVVRSDMACGSTIGPITASGIGIETVDVGVPTFAMHSIRELAGSDDAHSLYRVMSQFFSVD